MPYGIAKDAGGDSTENDAKMERCVRGRMKEGHSKVSAIRICKSSIQHGARKRKERNAFRSR